MLDTYKKRAGFACRLERTGPRLAPRSSILGNNFHHNFKWKYIILLIPYLKWLDIYNVFRKSYRYVISCQILIINCMFFLVCQIVYSCLSSYAMYEGNPVVLVSLFENAHNMTIWVTFYITYLACVTSICITKIIRQ
jgi:hypothetical protein